MSWVFWIAIVVVGVVVLIAVIVLGGFIQFPRLSRPSQAKEQPRVLRSFRVTINNCSNNNSNSSSSSSSGNYRLAVVVVLSTRTVY